MRDTAIEYLYQELSTLLRRRRDLSNDVHPGLSLVAFTVLSQIETAPGVCAADLAILFGIDKSTVSRQLGHLEATGLIRREGEKPGRRGYPLVVTARGRRQLADAAARLRRRLSERLVAWDEQDIETFAQLVAKFNQIPA
jgi:DNA-binding MarR family transcriptional regulator